MKKLDAVEGFIEFINDEEFENNLYKVSHHISVYSMVSSEEKEELSVFLDNIMHHVYRLDYEHLKPHMKGEKK